MPAARLPASGTVLSDLALALSDSDSAQNANKGRLRGAVQADRGWRRRQAAETGGGDTRQRQSDTGPAADTVRHGTGDRQSDASEGAAEEAADASAGSATVTGSRETGASSASDMTLYTITFFPVHGRAESIRLLLADKGAEWKEECVPFLEWVDGKCDLKKQTIFGQLPKFSDGDFVLYQSNAILRYLGRKYGLCGKSDKEAALMDMMNDGVEDIRMKFGHFFKTEYVDQRCYIGFNMIDAHVKKKLLNSHTDTVWIGKKTGKEKYVADLPKQFCPFEGILAKNPGGFLVGDQISFADYNLFHILLTHIDLAPDCLDAFPHLKDYVTMMESRPKIMAYMESEGYKSRPCIPKF